MTLASCSEVCLIVRSYSAQAETLLRSEPPITDKRYSERHLNRTNALSEHFEQ
jgi:hypothetical protein